MTKAKRDRIAVLVESQYIPKELQIYKKVFTENGFHVDFVSRLRYPGGDNSKLTFVSEVEEAGKTPETIEVSIDFRDIDLEKYAAVIAAANYVTVRLRWSEEGDPRKAPAVKFFLKVMKDPEIVKGALCHALWLLTPTTENLAGRKVICHEVVEADIRNAGGIITKEADNVVVDGDLVTGKTAAEAEAMSESIIAKIIELRNSPKQTCCTEEESEPKQEQSSLETGQRRILILLSEWGYWGEELVGPVEVFDKKGYCLDFCTPNGRRPNAIPVSMDPDFIDPPLGRSVTSLEMALKVREFDNPETPHGKRLANPISMKDWFPERPYASSPCYVRMLEAYNRDLDAARKHIDEYDALLIVGGRALLLTLSIMDESMI